MSLLIIGHWNTIGVGSAWEVVVDVVVRDPIGAEVCDEVRDIPDYERQNKRS
jgi:hypothetical protein